MQYDMLVIQYSDGWSHHVTYKNFQFLNEISFSVIYSVIILMAALCCFV